MCVFVRECVFDNNVPPVRVVLMVLCTHTDLDGWIWF